MEVFPKGDRVRLLGDLLKEELLGVISRDDGSWRRSSQKSRGPGSGPHEEDLLKEGRCFQGKELMKVISEMLRSWRMSSQRRRA